MFIKKAGIALFSLTVFVALQFYGLNLLPGQYSTGSASQAAPRSDDLAPLVELRSAAGAVVQFYSQNGQVMHGNPPEMSFLPHLVLKRNGQPASLSERTLFVSVEGLETPPAGAFVTVSFETQHGDPDQGGKEEDRIQVWSETVWVPGSSQGPRLASFELEAVFEPEMHLDGQVIKTPTDYYRYQISVHANDLERSLLASYSADFAFLLENQWIAPIEVIPGKANLTGVTDLAIYYSDMFPFGTSIHSPEYRLPRQQVDEFIQVELVPAMLESIRTQTEGWGFTWHEEWVSYRPNDVPGRLSVALFKRGLWYHGVVSSAGHSGISIRVDGGMGDYQSLADGIMATFHHEFFHNLQRGINLHLGGDGEIGGKDGAWMFFSEGTAELATAVAQPDIQFTKDHGERSYPRKTAGFVGREGISNGSLNMGPQEISPYDAAVYWRYLYEQCGGLAGEVEDPAAGMEVIRSTLEILYAAEVVDVSTSTELIRYLPEIMDRVFEKTPACPFESYDDSLLHFSRAIYLLKTEDGRCLEHRALDTCGFYDPNQIYPTPPSQVIALTGDANQPPPARIDITGRAPGSYGIDLIDVIVGSSLDVNSVTVEFAYPPRGEYSLQVMKLVDNEGKSLPVLVDDPVVVVNNRSAERLTYQIPEDERSEATRLGLVITRLDRGEPGDSQAEYSIVLHIVE
jgi:hypothetical protein